MPERIIYCQRQECEATATVGALYEHHSGSMTAHPIYYFCDEHLHTDKLVCAWIANA